jgi:hypothetical protein
MCLSVGGDEAVVMATEQPLTATRSGSSLSNGGRRRRAERRSSMFRHLVIVGALGSLFTDCGSLLGPSQSDSNYVDGQVTDTAFRPLPGARIEIADGPSAGLSKSADNSGNFQFVAKANGTVTLRVSRTGFENATTTATWQPQQSRGWTHVSLQPVESSLAMATGRYGLTVTSDPFGDCADLPSELVSRTYEGNIRVSSRANYAYDFVIIPGAPTVTRPYGNFSFGVAGSYIGWDEIDDNIFFEEFPGFRYLMIYGQAPTAEPAIFSESSVMVPFNGTFRYCQLKMALGGYNDCSQVPTDQIIELRQCSSSHDMMVFTKR